MESRQTCERYAVGVKKVVQALRKTKRQLSGSHRPRHGFQNGTLLRVNRANEAVRLRQGAPVIFFSDASSACPPVRPSIHSDSSWSIGRKHPVTEH